jgi:hypothetical protein
MICLRLPKEDFAVLRHGFISHGRDYVILIEDCLGSDPGQHEIVFTHCVEADCENCVSAEAWVQSWSDEFTDYKRWTTEGERDGYVWGTNWSLAYPGLPATPDSALADEWSRRLSREMFEITLTTDRFFLQIIHHSIRSS